MAVLLVGPWVVPVQAGPGAPTTAPEGRSTIGGCYANLEILRLAVSEELRHREIAAVVGCAEAAVAVRLHRVPNRLPRKIGKEERRAGRETLRKPEWRAEGPAS